jgi:hypothetical protein
MAVEFCLRSISFLLVGSLTFCKVLQHGPTVVLTSEGSRAADFYRPQPGLNPRTLGPLSSTLTLDHQGRPLKPNHF